jgi:hypothetical protein
MLARLMFFVVLIGFNDAEARPPLSESEAVARAEQFVIENGYTELPADLAKVELEITDHPRKVPIAKIAARRRGELEKDAWGVARGRRGGSPGWTVAFRYGSRMRGRSMLDPSDTILSADNGRGVTMDPDGENIVIEHVDIRLSAVKRIHRKASSTSQ